MNYTHLLLVALMAFLGYTKAQANSPQTLLETLKALPAVQKLGVQFDPADAFVKVTDEDATSLYAVEVGSTNLWIVFFTKGKPVLVTRYYKSGENLKALSVLRDVEVDLGPIGQYLTNGSFNPEKSDQLGKLLDPLIGAETNYFLDPIAEPEPQRLRIQSSGVSASELPFEPRGPCSFNESDPTLDRFKDYTNSLSALNSVSRNLVINIIVTAVGGRANVVTNLPNLGSVTDAIRAAYAVFYNELAFYIRDVFKVCPPGVQPGTLPKEIKIKGVVGQVQPLLPENFGALFKAKTNTPVDLPISIKLSTTDDFRLEPTKFIFSAAPGSTFNVPLRAQCPGDPKVISATLTVYTYNKAVIGGTNAKPGTATPFFKTTLQPQNLGTVKVSVDC
jgi:hypothetical protein